ncbi:MAG: bi-domain-containing oxidoreductase [Pirellulaceae bacterium]|nr:bi-domain-containing oxidoreductase [Pirellulaceae bacterium]
MKQILQNLGNGETILAEVPVPRRGSGAVLIQTTQTLVSLGTEKMLIEFGKSGWLAKARSQPDKVKQVLQKIKTDGLWATLETVRAKLDTPIPLGYCNVGVVRESGVHSPYPPGTRVVSNGPHAEWVAIPENLMAKIPEKVSDEAAVFTVIGAIALQGIRLIGPTLGERVVVSGLGLIGLIAVQILRANGCQVLGIDFDPKKLALARQFGAETVDLAAGQDPMAVAEQWSQGIGVDAVLITASAKSDELMHQAATMCRQRGRIVLVGVVGLNLRRADFYEKELSFQVSCSYGPGRYDDNYEKRGLDYPIGFVRWTEKRNFEAILQLMADGLIDVAPLISHRFDFDEALAGYQAVSDPQAMGILLGYAGNDSQATSQNDEVQENTPAAPRISGPRSIPAHSGSLINIAFVGAGGFTTRMLLPLLPKSGIGRAAIVSSTGVSAAHAAKKFGFDRALSDFGEVLSDPKIDAVFVTTPHSLHAGMVCQALQSRKHVFVEKPLAMTGEELEMVREAVEQTPDRCLLVGFNRRFSPHLTRMKQWLKAAPANKALIITVNAGAIPEDHWTQDPTVGGGRIIGEGCHFVDCARYLVGHSIVDSAAFPVRGGEGRLGDCVALQLTFSDGSTATIHYLSNGSKDFPKERIEVFAGGKVYVCNNFRTTYEVGGKNKFSTRSQDKGHAEELKQFLTAIERGGEWPIPWSELHEVSDHSLRLARNLR